MRGNSRNSTIVSGAAFSSDHPTIFILRAAGRSASSRLTLTSTKNSAATAISVISATPGPWLCMNCVSRMKKHRKMTTNTSRRARISSSFSAISRSRKVTPASCPTSVPCCRYTPAAAPISSGSSRMRPGTDSCFAAMTPRHRSITSSSSVAHQGRCSKWGTTTNVTASSSTRMSRRSRAPLDVCGPNSRFERPRHARGARSPCFAVQLPPCQPLQTASAVRQRSRCCAPLPMSIIASGRRRP